MKHIKRLENEEWLDAAKRTPVGHTRRVVHGAEDRPNMVVRNEMGYWSAYCHRCHCGARLDKEHVKLVQPQKMAREKPGTTPGLLRPISDLDIRTQSLILEHWQEKGVSEPVVRPLSPMWSQQDQRIVYTSSDGQIGRTLDKHHPSKWHSYLHSQGFMRASVGLGFAGRRAVITEDFYSAAKIQAYAQGDVVAVAALGTRVNAGLTVLLAQAAEVCLAFDDDDAGHEANAYVSRALALMGIKHSVFICGRGRDPKDLSPDEIEEHF